MIFPASHMMMIIIAISALAMASTDASAVSDPMDRPAAIVGQKSNSVLLAVTIAGKRLVAVGERGRILLSDDDGNTWRQAKVPVSVTLTAVRFLTPLRGVAVGHSGMVLLTEDSGETWVKRLDGREAARLVYDSAQASGRRGAKATEATSELAAAKQLVEDGPDKPFLDLCFIDEQTGFIVGAYNMIFRTTDGGRTWIPWQHHVENPKGLHLYMIRTSGREIYIAGEQGLFLRSSNAGNSFKAIPTPYPGTFFGLIGGNSGDLVLFGLRGNAFWSGNRGQTWKKIDTGVSRSITAGVELRDGRLVLVTETGEVLVSRDRGHAFQQLRIGEPSPFADVTEASDGSLTMVGLRGETRIPSGSPLTTHDRTGR